jgi:hypothetical protein
MADSTIRIYVYDLAQVSTASLNRALSEAERVMNFSGVKTAWHLRSAEAEDGFFDPDRTPTDLFVRILPESVSSRFTKRSTVLGFTQPVGRERFRYVASIFYQRVQQAAGDVGGNIGAVLGHVMAHEVGHLLLGPNAHAPMGLMRCPWNVHELNAAGQGRLRFSNKQAAEIRRRVAERALAASAAE